MDDLANGLSSATAAVLGYYIGHRQAGDISRLRGTAAYAIGAFGSAIVLNRVRIPQLIAKLK